MQSTTLKSLRAQQARVQAQLKRKQALEHLRTRKRDTRRKILVGALVLEWMERDDALAARVYAELSNFLTRRIDRSMFGGRLQRADVKEV